MYKPDNSYLDGIKAIVGKCEAGTLDPAGQKLLRSSHNHLKNYMELKQYGSPQEKAEMTALYGQLTKAKNALNAKDVLARHKNTKMMSVESLVAIENVKKESKNLAQLIKEGNEILSENIVADIVSFIQKQRMSAAYAR